MKHIFLSYSSQNSAEAEALRQTLEQNGIPVWMSSHSIEGGEEFSSAILQAIKSCSCFVLLLTEEAQRTPWVGKELERAIHYEKVIVPVQLHSVVLRDNFEFYLSNSQIVTLKQISDKDPSTQRLIKAVKGYLSGKKPLILPKTASGNTKRFNPALIFLPVVAVILVVAIGMFSLIPKLFANNSSLSNLFGQSLPTPSATAVNQIPDFFEDEVQAFKHADELSIRNCTLHVSVGDSVSIRTAWSDYVLYSEDTAIASVDGVLITGVSPGTTYVVIATSKTMSQVYRIIVE